jgi:4-hydroxybenzoate polyprenyltransferase
MHPWLRLLRLPNWLTVPGEPLAGFFLAGAGAGTDGAAAVAAVLLIYGAGMVLNDVADVEIDRRERPDRPLPAGRIGRAQAGALGAALLICGFLCAAAVNMPALGTAVLLGSLVLAYTFVRRLRGLAGPVLLGACRALAVFLGIVAGGGEITSGAACVLAATLAYVTAFSRCARREMEDDKIPFLDPWWPLLVFAACYIPYAWLQPASESKAWLAGLLLALAALWFMGEAAKAYARPGSRPAAVGMWIGAILWMQGAWLAPLVPVSWVPLLPVTVVAAWLVMQAAGRKMPAS